MDDALDLFAEHAMGGIIGLIFNALFGAGSIIALDEVNTTMPGGWLDHNWKQLYIQIAYVVAATAYTFVVTAFLAKMLDMIPGLQLRSSEESEVLGMDESQVGCFGCWVGWKRTRLLTRRRLASSRLTMLRLHDTTLTATSPRRRCSRRRRLSLRATGTASRRPVCTSGILSLMARRRGERRTDTALRRVGAQ